MGKIIYIDNKLCSNIEQLRSYFNAPINYGSNIFMDILDYGRSGDLSSWLREHEENELALNIDDIDSNIGDGEYISRITDIINNHLFSHKTSSSLKPEPIQCFTIEDIKVGEDDSKFNVTISLKILQTVNEWYNIELKTLSETASKPIRLNPYDYKVGKVINIKFDFPLPAFDKSEIRVFVDGVELEKTEEPNSDNRKLTFKIGNSELNLIKVLYPKEYGKNEEENYYYISETLVTQSLWEEIMEYNPCNTETNRWSLSTSVIIGGNNPIVNINRFRCLRFIENLNKITGQRFRLPTEDEWYYASCCGNNNKNSKTALYNEIWCKKNSGNRIHEVMTKSPNALGLYDMYGNVWEYLYDELILRGGCCFSTLDECMSIKPDKVSKIFDRDNNLIGFRLVLDDFGTETFADIGLSVMWSRNCGYIEEARLPSEYEARELLEKCKMTLIDSDICKVTGPNGNYIFMHYESWYLISRSGHKNNSHYAFSIRYKQINDVYSKYIKYRIMVCEKNKTYGKTIYK